MRFYFKKKLILTNNVKQTIRIDSRRDWMVKTMDKRWTALVPNDLKVNDSGKNCKNQRQDGAAGCTYSSFSTTLFRTQSLLLVGIVLDDNDRDIRRSDDCCCRVDEWVIALGGSLAAAAADAVVIFWTKIDDAEERDGADVEDGENCEESKEKRANGDEMCHVVVEQEHGNAREESGNNFNKTKPIGEHVVIQF
jgi:hypothetical protein